MRDTVALDREWIAKPIRLAAFSVEPHREGEVMERLAAFIVHAARTGAGSAAGHGQGEGHAGCVWLDSGGPTLSRDSQSVLTGFAWQRARWSDPHDGDLPAFLASCAQEGQQAGPDEDVLEPPAREPRFRGGWLGFLGYESVEAFEPVHLRARRDLEVPVASWGLYPVWFSLRAGSGELELWSRLTVDTDRGPLGARPRTSEWLDWAERAIDGQWPTGPDAPGLVSDIQPGTTPGSVLSRAVRSFSRRGFQQAVRTVKEAVREGEVFQANLAHRLSVQTGSDPFTVYGALRRLNPSPFMAFMEEDWGALVCNSPERLFSVRRDAHGDRRVQMRPIAGTRPRGKTRQEERLLREELSSSGKERAEHTMLVDLVRNDVGRVSVPGSVRVRAFQRVEAYSHVHHLVSDVEGTLRDAVGADDLVRALFPGGTITGAPKLRSIEVIDSLEQVARGPYTGSLGYVNPDGTMDLNILIRTLIFHAGHAHAYAGAGIVAQSVPEKEFEETIHKAAAMLIALSATRSASGPGATEATSREDEESQWMHVARRGHPWPVAEGGA